MWPTGVPIRSMSVCLTGPDERRVKWDLDLDPLGRADARLAALYRGYLGDVIGPRLLDRAWSAKLAGDSPRAIEAAKIAEEAYGIAVAQQRGMPRWHAGRSLALALLRPRDDLALQEIRIALALAYQDIEVIELASRVMEVRGDYVEALRLISSALKLEIDAVHLQRAFTRVQGLDNTSRH
jgi:hypothetical protein